MKTLALAILVCLACSCSALATSAYDVTISTAPGSTVQFTLEGNPNGNDTSTVPLVVNGVAMTLNTSYATDQPIVTVPASGTLDVLADTSHMHDPADFLQMCVHTGAQPYRLDAVGIMPDQPPVIDAGNTVVQATSYFDAATSVSVGILPEPAPWLILLACAVLGLWRKRRIASI